MTKGRRQDLLTSGPLILLLAILLLPSQQLNAQEKSAKGLGPAGEPAKTMASPPAGEVEKNRRQRAVFLVKEFANRAFSFDDVSTKVLTLARFADLLWQDDEDHARQLFTRALDSCVPKPDASPADVSRVARLRREVIALIANRDVNLARKLTKESDNSGSASETAATNVRVANRLLQTQPEQAVGFAERSLESGVSLDLVFFLLRLRLENEAMANRLFLDVLKRLPAMKCMDPEGFIQLGTYVFTFQNTSLEPSVSPTAIKYISIGPVMLPDISVERPEVSQQLVRAYLEVGANVLSSPRCAFQDAGKLYAAGYLLLNKTTRLAPELSSRIASSLQSLRQDVPAELIAEDTYRKVESRSSGSLEDTLAEIEARTGVDHRDMQYFALVFDLWRRSDFKAARTVTSKISDLNLRERLVHLILFGEAARAIERASSLDEAERVITKLPLGIERALLRLGLASAYAKKKDLERSEESINAALSDARRLDDSRVPFLLLAAAGELAGIRSSDAMRVLGESVQKLNSTKVTPGEVLWQEKVTASALWRDWPLDIKGIRHSFIRALPELMKADPDVTVETVLKLTSETYLSEALLGVATVILKETGER